MKRAGEAFARPPFHLAVDERASARPRGFEPAAVLDEPKIKPDRESEVCIKGCRRYADVVTIIRWNGDDLPEELRELPPGSYVLQPVDELTVLTVDEEQGIADALDSLRAGRGIDHEAVRARILRHLP